MRKTTQTILLVATDPTLSLNGLIPLSNRQIADRVGCTFQNVALTLGSLRRQGYLKEVPKGQRRGSTTTAKGLQLITAIAKEPSHPLHDTALPIYNNLCSTGRI